MSGYRPEAFRNEGLVSRVRARRECGRVTSMGDVVGLGGGMIRERSEARPSMPSFVRPAPAQPDIVAMEGRLTALINSNGNGQGWVILTQVLCTVAIIATVVAMRFIG